ncbi:2711_t:CDS:2 [Ambispora gerdemannii]|uniref:2711_t:CDS:1 n=1 Tax=Ambispora gerdemannii TaxID=144530 RepID=A0A9N8UZZ4_9GLOM|nr:2711_t:CDS:2 [Ambispora gerdemannii]
MIKREFSLFILLTLLISIINLNGFLLYVKADVSNVPSPTPNPNDNSGSNDPSSKTMTTLSTQSPNTPPSNTQTQPPAINTNGVVTSSVIATPTPGISGTSNNSLFSDKVIVGYYPEWRFTQFAVNNLFFDKLTHVNYAFALLNDDFAPNLQNTATLTTLVWYAHVSKVKVSIAIGGWSGSKSFSTMVSSVANRATFISATVAMVKQYNLDGVDIDWEFPGRKGLKCNIFNSQSDTSNFLLLLKELREALGQDKLITLAVRAETFDGPNGPITDVSEFAKVVDWINIMAYDLSVDDESGEDWIKSTGPNAPFMTTPGKGRQLSFTQSATSWLKAGMPASKIVMGVEFLGHSQTALQPMTPDSQYAPRDSIIAKGDINDELWSPKSCPSVTPAFTGIWFWKNLRQQGILKCTLTASEGWVRTFDNVTQTPWLYNPSTKMYISYDDPASLFVKIDYTRKQGFRGMMLWDLTTDNGRELLDVIQLLRQNTIITPENDCSSSSSTLTGNGAAGGGSNNDSVDKKKKSLGAGAIIGLSIGSVFLVASVGIVFLCLRKRRKGGCWLLMPGASVRPKSIPVRPISSDANTMVEIPIHKKYVIAVFNYDAREEVDLSFRKGDLIEVLQRGDGPDDWWLGRLDDKIGEFPGNYVKDEF